MEYVCVGLGTGSEQQQAAHRQVLEAYAAAHGLPTKDCPDE